MTTSGYYLILQSLRILVREYGMLELIIAYNYVICIDLFQFL